MNLCDLMSAWSIDLILCNEYRFNVHLKLNESVMVSIGVGEMYYCSPREKLKNINGYSQVEAKFFYVNKDMEFHADVLIPENYPMREEYLGLFETVDYDLVTYAGIEELHSLMSLIARKTMSKIDDLNKFSDKEDYFMGREIEEDYRPDHAYQIISFVDWDDDLEMDKILERAYEKGYPVEETYIMAARNPDFLTREFFEENAVKITYLFENKPEDTFNIMKAVEVMQLEPHEFKWI